MLHLDSKLDEERLLIFGQANTKHAQGGSILFCTLLLAQHLVEACLAYWHCAKYLLAYLGIIHHDLLSQVWPSCIT